MYFKPLLYPLFAQVLLAFIVLYTLARQRVTEIKQNRIHPQTVDLRKNSQEIFKKSAATSDNFLNQFETPVLFYLAILISMALLIQDGIVVVLAWSYVALRYAHCLIHLTYNRVMHRFTVYVFSVVVLFSIWVRLGWLILY